MNLQDRINILTQLKYALNDNKEEFEQIKTEAYLHNKWFTIDNINKSIASIQTSFLDKSKLKKWTSKYTISNRDTNKNIGIIMAGNIPLVGFHDLLSVFITGHTALIKLSSKDKILMEYVIKQIINIEPKTNKLFQFVERLQNIDAIIATGSNNSYRYFDYYFGKYPNILRKNRNGTAVIIGDETEKQLESLANDIFDYFGLGCRNISKIYVPENYDFPHLLKILDKHQYLKQHNKYMNNYDYNLAIAMLNKEKLYQGEIVILKEDISYLSRIANIHYEEYHNLQEVKNRISNDKELVQLASTKSGNILDFEREVEFGTTQIPALEDYSDGVDIMEFLVSI